MTRPKDELTRLRYLKWQTLYESEKPFQVFSAIPLDAAEQRNTNLVLELAEPEVIHDIRGIESQFTLDKNGFMIRRQPMPDTDLSTEQKIRTEYAPHIEMLLKQEIDGADKVFLFDWGIRINKSLGVNTMDAKDKTQLLEPAKQVHCDQSAAGAISRLQHHLPEEVDRALEGRLRIINMWRPLEHCVEDNPLAVCDASTVTEAELIEADHISRQYHGSQIFGLYSPNHKWYYLNRQSPEEILFLKIFDSKPDAATHCLHASFLHTEIPPGTLPRMSIEARFLIITYPENL